MIPAEFLGRARQLRWRVQAADDLVEPAMDRVLEPIKERLARHPRKPIRLGTLTDARRVWQQQMPAYGRIGSTCKIDDAWSPAFHEVRIGAVKFACTGWGEAADGLAVSLISVKVYCGTLTIEPTILGAASLHALGRRFERGTRNEAEVLDDLGQLAWRYIDLADSNAEQFAIAVPSGQWAGSLRLLDGRVGLLAQTFLHTGGAASSSPQQDIEALIDALPALELVE